MNSCTMLRRAAITVFSLIFVWTGAMSLDLPVKKVKGVEYYYYKVKNKETVYGVSKRLGLSRDEIVRYNPSAADGLKKNMMLYFPVADFPGEGTPVADEPEVQTDTIAADSITVPQKSGSVAIMLPFDLDSQEQSRSGKLSVDFYKGVLIAADTLANRPGNVEIKAFDTKGDIETVKKLLATDPFIAKASVIIAPDDENTLKAIADSAAIRGNYVLTLMNVRDSAYLTNPFVIQANIPQLAMYTLAADAIDEDFQGYTPVILRNISGRNEKEPFTAYLKKRFQDKGINPVEIEYDGSLTASALNSLPVNAGEKYVVIPSSGTLAEFNKIAYVLKNWKDKVLATETSTDTPDVAVFGYPDWTAFRGDALDMLQRLEVTVYSRFFDDFEGFDARNIDSDFRRWYGSPMIESVPSQALLGFDAASCIIKNLRANEGTFNPSYPTVYQGIQSVFKFERSGEGFVNTSLYIIKYRPDGRIQSRTI